MHSHARQEPIPAIVIVPRLQKPDEFKTELEFSLYFESLDMACKISLAVMNLPLAQRLLAIHYQGIHDSHISTVWWIRAAQNNDPIAHLHGAQVMGVQGKLDQAEATVKEASELAERSTDGGFRSYFESYKKQILSEISCVLDLQAAQALAQNKNEEAIQLWLKSFELNNSPYSAANLHAFLSKNSSKQAEAIFWAEQTLHLSNQGISREDQLVLRADAHYTLGTLKQSANRTRKYSVVFEIASHFKKAATYSPNKPQYANSLKAFIDSRFSDDDYLTKNVLYMELEPRLSPSFHVVKLLSERVDNQITCPVQYSKWMQYPAPSRTPTPSPSDGSSETSVSLLGHFSSRNRNATSPSNLDPHSRGPSLVNMTDDSPQASQVTQVNNNNNGQGTGAAHGLTIHG